jgi:hypothetical protein
MKKLVLFLLITLATINANSQWDDNGDSFTTGSIFAGGTITAGHSSGYNATLTNAVLAFSRNSANYVWATNQGGYLLFGVNGDQKGFANAALGIKGTKEAFFSNNLSIGTNETTGYKLFVQGTTKIAGTLVASQLQFNNTTTNLRIYEDSDIPNWSLLRSDVGNGIAIVGMPDQISISVSRSNGNVGIGTTNPGSYKLAVQGKLGAREVVVTEADWADFVFSPTYTLKPLEEVEQFIKANKHLPNVPSEKEVKEKGLNLGQSDAVLLQKIEELTLYLIEQNKKTKEQSEKIKELEEAKVETEKEVERLKSIEKKHVAQQSTLNELLKRVERLESNN